MKSEMVPSSQLKLAYVVDDEPVLAEMMGIALEFADLEVKSFTDPEAALDAFVTAPVKPALLVTDYYMDRCNGLQLVASCRKANPNLKIILVCGSVLSDQVLKAGAEVDRFLLKPFHATELIAAAQEVLGEPKKPAAGISSVERASVDLQRL